jgi:integrative and conjugative element protein (TIGR02256 family)
MRPRCWIDERAYGELVAESNRWRVRETGGALLGWRDGINAVISHVLGPGPAAKHGLRTFEPDAPWHAVESRKIYSATGRRVAYVGDWHTHPIALPLPSSQDRIAARTISDDPGFRAPRPLSAILGRERRLPWGSWHLAVYVWVEDEFHPMEVDKRELGLDRLLRG